MITDKEEVKKTIQKNIFYKAEDTCLNHLKTFWKSDGKLTGVANDDGFRIWASHWYLAGIMHVIAVGRFTDQKIIVRTKINKVGKIFIFLFLSFWMITTFLFIFYQGDSLSFSIRAIISWLLLQAMIIVPMTAGYFLERKNILSKVENIITKC